MRPPEGRGMGTPHPRRHLGAISIALASLALASTAAAEPGATAAARIAAQPEKVVDRLMKKRVVLIHDEDDQYVKALVIFEQPLARTLSLLSETARQVEFRKDLKGVETLEVYEDGTLDRQRMKIMFIKMVYHLRYRIDPERRRIAWELDLSYENDARRLEGFWELHEMDENRTLARFGTLVDIGPALPGFLQDYATRKNVPKSVDQARRWVNSDGTWRP
jgi:hypothetical protein